MVADSANEELDQVFQCIERGNSHENSEEYWDASAEFSQATELLCKLAADTLPVDEEAMRIAQLYHVQSREYLYRARQVLIQALTKEVKEDKERAEAKEDPFKSTLSVDDAECRLRLFMALFSKEVALASDVPELSATQQAASLEERLMELNASLPSGFKTDSERMRDINRGLRSLGLSSAIACDEKPKLDLLAIPLSYEDQMSEIISQARDEATFETLNGQTESHQTNEPHVEFLEDDYDDDDDDYDEKTFSLEGNSDEEPPKLRQKTKILKLLNEAQVKLAELVAILDAGNGLNDDDREAKEFEDDTSQENMIEKAFAHLDLRYGENLLKESRKCLSKAQQKWSDDIDA